MKPIIIQIAIAAVFAVVAYLLVKKVPAIIDIAFIIAAALVGFFLMKNNKSIIDKLK